MKNIPASSVLPFIFIIFAAVSIFNHAAGSMVIYDNATIILNKSFCHLLPGRIDGEVCILQADLSHTLVASNPVIRLKDGTIMNLNSNDVLSYSYTKARYSFNW